MPLKMQWHIVKKNHQQHVSDKKVCSLEVKINIIAQVVMRTYNNINIFKKAAKEMEEKLLTLVVPINFCVVS